MSLKKLSIFFILLFNCVVMTVFAADNDALSSLLKNMRSMQADFVQTVINKNGKALSKSTGHMSLQRPSQFRWDVTQPVKQLIVTNGVRLWIYDPELEQVTIRSLVKTAGETPALLLSDENLSLAKEFNVNAFNKPSSNMQWFTLIPKDKSSMISTLTLAFDKGEIKQMQLQDHLGHTTLIQFKNVKLNSSLPSSLFSFKPPARVDIIDETKRR